MIIECTTVTWNFNKWNNTVVSQLTLVWYVFYYSILNPHTIIQGKNINFQIELFTLSRRVIWGAQFELLGKTRSGINRAPPNSRNEGLHFVLVFDSPKLEKAFSFFFFLYWLFSDHFHWSAIGIYYSISPDRSTIILLCFGSVTIDSEHQMHEKISWECFTKTKIDFKLDLNMAWRLCHCLLSPFTGIGLSREVQIVVTNLQNLHFFIIHYYQNVI